MRKYFRVDGERRELAFSPEPKVIRNPEMLIQYILVRTDMASMGIGRVAAQCTHAGNQMEWDSTHYRSSQYITRANDDAGLAGQDHAIHVHKDFPNIEKTEAQLCAEKKGTVDLIKQWRREANGFGTAIVLDGGNERTVRKTVEAAVAAGLHAALVIDPEYYIMDGQAPMRVENVLTCGYIFGRKDMCAPFSSDFKLLGC